MVLLSNVPVSALTPGEVIVVVNSMVPSSRELGEYYCKARGVPQENLVALPMPKAEEMTREEYEKWIVKPLCEELKTRKDAKCLLLMAGVPLRVGGKLPNDGEKAVLERLKPALEEAKTQAASADAATAAKGKAEVATVQTQILQLEQRESVASVDSELMLLWWDDVPLARWVLNPRHWQAHEKLGKGKPPVLLTCRLDGPSTAIVKRLIDDAIAVEAEGLAGKVYVDAWAKPFDPKAPGENGGYGYGGYDESMREMAAMFKTAQWDVTLDNTDKLFAAKSCPDAALYCGWYSHAQFIDSMTFKKGAVAWHLASSEAVSLRKDSTLWCPNLLKAGVAATIGPVAEPYTVGFPKPAEFFGFLGTGHYTLAEVHGRTQHFCSWVMVCIGDPLYNPFKKNPIFKESDVVSSPKAGKSLFK